MVYIVRKEDMDKYYEVAAEAIGKAKKKPEDTKGDGDTTPKWKANLRFWSTDKQ